MDALIWMHNIGIAILTILISVSIFIMQDAQRFGWDNLVILDKIIEAKRLVVALLLIFVPVLFWDKNNMWNWCNITILLLFLIGVIYCGKILLNSYKWIRVIEMNGISDDKNGSVKYFV